MILVSLMLFISCGQHTADYYGYKNSVDTTTIVQDESDRGRLLEAIQSNDMPSLDGLIQKGVDLNLALPNGNPPLIEAILWERAEIVLLFLEKGVNRECVDRDGKSAKELSENSSDAIYNIFHPEALIEIEEE
jgi:ankyrin repeat protein